MEIKKIIKWCLGIFMVFAIGFVSHKTNAQAKPYAKTKPEKIVNTEIDINVTISNITTEQELEEIKAMLATNGIESEFTNIARNNAGELLGINIKIYTKNHQSVTSSLSNILGIGNITFGRKNGQLYITQNGGNANNLAFFNFPGVKSFGFENDSVMKQYFDRFGSFTDNFFEDDKFMLSYGGGHELQELIAKMKSQFQSYPFGNHGNIRFIDDPESEKLIMIDGQESNFETLDKLAKENKISEVDFLKPATAMSLYGEKAKDGAVIVTTKKDKAS